MLRLLLFFGGMSFVFSVISQDSLSSFETFSIKTPIVFRLKTEKKKIEALKKGDEKKAEAYQKRLEEVNRAFVEAFSGSFHLNKVYFIYADDKIESEGVFLNQHLERDATISIPSSHYLIADYGEMDTQQMSMNTLYLRDQHMSFPEKNFPFYVKLNEVGPLETFFRSIFDPKSSDPIYFTKSPLEAVQQLERKLKQYLKK